MNYTLSNDERLFSTASSAVGSDSAVKASPIRETEKPGVPNKKETGEERRSAARSNARKPGEIFGWILS